jgi:HlyD family secretion protein
MPKMFKNLKKILLVLLTVIASFAAIHFFMSDKEKDNNLHTQQAALSVTVLKPQEQNISVGFWVSGKTVAKEDVMVLAEISGARVLDIKADVGDWVEKDTLLATLQDESLAFRLNDAKAEYARASDEFKRTERIQNSGAISRESVMQKQTAMESAEARMREAELNMQRQDIRAPFSGRVYERNAKLGAQVNASDALFKIAQDGLIEIEAAIPEKELENIRPGQKARLQISGITDDMTGIIRKVTPFIDNNTRTSSIRLQIEEKRELPVGLFSKIYIEGKTVSGQALPITALQRNETDTYIWIISNDSKVERLPISVSFSNDQVFLVSQKLPPTLQVVAKAGLFLKEGDVVNIAETQ